MVVYNDLVEQFFKERVEGGIAEHTQLLSGLNFGSV